MAIKIRNLAANETYVHIDQKYTLLLSYQTYVGYSDHTAREAQYFVVRGNHSRTTKKHIKGLVLEDSPIVISQQEMNSLVESLGIAVHRA